MVEWYEWVFLICYTSLVLGGLMVLYEIYAAVMERRAAGHARDASPRPRPRAKMYSRVRERGVMTDLRRQHAGR
jgi:hypothetical protein